MAVNNRAPVIVGVHQIKQRPDDPIEADEAVALMTAAVEGAAGDAGATSLLSKIDLVAVIEGAWKYSDPGRLIADRVGSADARTGISANGGNSPQSLVNKIGNRIQAGELDVAVITGAEIIWSRRRQRRAGHKATYTVQEGVSPDEQLGIDVPMSSDFESARGMDAPINYYPMFESAIRAARGETLDQHRDRVAGLWARFNQVAVDNEYAWFRTPMTADEIRNPSPSNRMVGFPYTKAMNSNWDLDQAAAILICSAEAAEAAGVAKDRWVFPHVGTDAHDTYLVSERRDLHSSPAIVEAGTRLFEMAGMGPDDVDHIDIYSCFPSAVQVAADSLGIDQSRQLTQTGGLTFAGGPLNNYVSHSIAAMTDVLRADAGSVGLVTANGGYLTKHALGLYSTQPPSEPFRAVDVQDAVDQIPTTTVAADHTGPVTVEAYTVMHDADGPSEGLFALRTAEGARTWGRSTERAALDQSLTTETIGVNGDLDATGTVTLS